MNKSDIYFQAGQFSNHLLKKRETWQKVANDLNASGGHQYTAEEVDKKWRGLKERYKKIKDSSNSTGRGRSMWQFYDDMEAVLQNDIAVSPPCVITAGSSFTVEVRESTDPAAAASQEPAPQPRMTKTGAKRKEPPTWKAEFLQDAKKHHRIIRKEIRALTGR